VAGLVWKPGRSSDRLEIHCSLVLMALAISDDPRAAEVTARSIATAPVGCLPAAQSGRGYGVDRGYGTFQNRREKRASRYWPSLAVALNWGTGSSSLNADVKAFERLHIVRGRNSSYFGSK
jgi:hypothetical protein